MKVECMNHAFESKDVAIKVTMSPQELAAINAASSAPAPIPGMEPSAIVAIFTPAHLGPDSLLGRMGPAPENMTASPDGPNPDYNPNAAGPAPSVANIPTGAPRSGPDFEGIEALIQERRSRASAVEAASKIGVDKAAGLIFADGVDVFRNNTFSRFDIPQHLREQALALLGQIVAYHEAEIVRIDSSFAGVQIPGN